jgi:hypothetical protein
MSCSASQNETRATFAEACAPLARHPASPAHAKLVRTNPPRRIVRSDNFVQSRRHPLQQVIPRIVTTRHVHQAESIQIEVHQRMSYALFATRYERLINAFAKGLPIEQPRQYVVTRLPRDLQRHELLHVRITENHDFAVRFCPDRMTDREDLSVFPMQKRGMTNRRGRYIDGTWSYRGKSERCDRDASNTKNLGKRHTPFFIERFA